MPRRSPLIFIVLSLAATTVSSTICRAQSSAADLDSVVRRMMTQEHVVGASVLVARNGAIVLHKGYGLADLQLDAPAKDETVYHVVGPMLPFTGIAVMQLVDHGTLSLDDDVSKYVPEFPMQGHHVTIRQLLNHTSGIVDYHYLGDPIEATSRQPKGLDEVMALYAGKKWVNEPGTKWDWSISGFQLLVSIVERVTGQSFPDYVGQHILQPAGVKSTSYCDDFSLVHGLARPYRRFGTSFVPANENDMAYNSDLRWCSTVGDIYQLWESIRTKKLVEPKTFDMMTTAEGAAAHMSAQDPQAQYGFAITINHEETHRRIGQHGSLLGYSGSLYDFPQDNLTIVVLTNTEEQNAYAITRALARTILGLPQLPVTPAAPIPALANRPRVSTRAHATRWHLRLTIGGRRPRLARLVRAIPPHLPGLRRRRPPDDPAAGHGAGAIAETGRRHVRDALEAPQPHLVHATRHRRHKHEDRPFRLRRPALRRSRRPRRPRDVPPST